VSRQAYYKQSSAHAHVSRRDDLIVQKVQRIRADHKVMGGRKLFRLLGDEIRQLGRGLGRDKFFDVLRGADLLVKRRRRYARTTDSRHRFRVYKNLMLNYGAKAPHQAWVGDITYVRLKRGGFMYLFLLTDAYSRKIVGWQLSSSLGVQGARSALEMAIRQCPDTRDVIHHTDRGFQYCTNQYVQRLKQKGIKVSIAEAVNCYENAMAERINGILKEEYGLNETFEDCELALRATKQAIKSYNEGRPHWSLNFEIPAIVHTKNKPLQAGALL